MDEWCESKRVHEYNNPVERSGRFQKTDSPYAKKVEECGYMEKSEEDRVEVIESENVEEEPKGDGEPIQGEKVEEEDATEKDKKTETGKDTHQKKDDGEPLAPGKKKSGVPMAGLTITVLGAIGIAGAVVLDPMMNAVDSSHPAAIAIGTMQMVGIAVAAVVLVAGVLVSMKRKK